MPTLIYRRIRETAAGAKSSPPPQTMSPGLADWKVSSATFGFPHQPRTGQRRQPFLSFTSSEKSLPQAWSTTTAESPTALARFDSTGDNARFAASLSLAANVVSTLCTADHTNFMIRQNIPMGLNYSVTTLVVPAGNSGANDTLSNQVRF